MAVIRQLVGAEEMVSAEVLVVALQVIVFQKVFFSAMSAIKQYIEKINKAFANVIVTWFCFYSYK